MTKESIIELQKIDCNCNDCKYLFRLLDKQNNVLNNDKISQEEIFYLVKDKRSNDIKDNIGSLIKNKELIKNADVLINKQRNKLKVIEGEKYGYQGQRTPCLYGVCCKFNKEVTFIANTCQLETQNCFEHRRNIT
jgi:hypothetical protein